MISQPRVKHRPSSTRLLFVGLRRAATDLSVDAADAHKEHGAEQDHPRWQPCSNDIHNPAHCLKARTVVHVGEGRLGYLRVIDVQEVQQRSPSRADIEYQEALLRQLPLQLPAKAF